MNSTSETNMSPHLKDETFPNVVIEVSSPSSSTQTFLAHKEILNHHPKLAAIIPSSPGGARGGKAVKAVVSNVKPSVFHIVLLFIYGVKVPKKELKKHAKCLIHAAEMFSLRDLKAMAEKEYVKLNTITIDNVVKSLCFAGDKQLPLLKRAAEHFIADSKKESIRELSFAKLPSKLVQDLLFATKRRSAEKAVEQIQRLLSPIYPDLMRSDLTPELKWVFCTLVHGKKRKMNYPVQEKK